MMQFKVDPLHEFAYELSCIASELHKNIAIAALNKVPDYFWFVPASSSGKHHPISSIGMGGLVRHVKAVFAISEELLNHPTLYTPTFTPATKDEIRVAIILHDTCKQGFDQEPTHTLHEHPLLPSAHLKPDNLCKDGELAWGYICSVIETHMGPWVKDSKEKSTIILQEPQTTAQKFMHMCDYLASRKIIEVDVTPREAQLGYPPAKNDEWKDEPATTNQINFIVSLYREGVQRKMDVSAYKNLPDPLTKSVASQKIEELRELLGKK
jgi:hypothetical protein